MKLVVLILVLVVAAGAVFLRLQQPDAVGAHVDPRTLPDPGKGGVKLTGDDAPVFEAPPEAVLAAFEQVAQAAPRSEVIAGSTAEGMVTVVVKSRAWGFQDYVTAMAEQDGATTRLHLAARTRYPGASDWGVNRQRLERWLIEVAERLGEAG